MFDSERRALIIGDGLNTLTLEPGPTQHQDRYVRATLSTPNLRGRADLHEGPGVAEFSEILDLLESFVPDWRGWAGERSWYSLDGDLVLHARHDRVGQVVIRVVLRNVHEDWRCLRSNWWSSLGT